MSSDYITVSRVSLYDDGMVAASGREASVVLLLSDVGNDSPGELLAFGGGDSASFLAASTGENAAGVRYGIWLHTRVDLLASDGLEVLSANAGTLQLTGLAAVPGSGPTTGSFYVSGAKTGQVMVVSSRFDSPLVLQGHPDSGSKEEAFVLKFSPPQPER